MTAVESTGRAAEPPELEPITGELKSPPSGLGQMTFAEAGAALKHYRPVVAAVFAVLVLAVLLPGPRRVVLEGFSATSDFASTSSVSADEVAEAPLADGGIVAPEPAPAPGLSGGFGSSSFDSAAGDDFATADTAPSNRSEPEPSPSQDFSFSSPSSPSTTAAPKPLRIVESTWATRTAGTPLASEGVPEGSLPVGIRLNQDDKQSFVRLSGTATTLTLPVGPAAGQRSPETASVQICRIEDASWKAGKAIAWDARPEYSTEDCVVGKRSSDGKAWVFEVIGIGDRNSNAGFALVPGPDAPIDFQVAFEGS